MFNPLTALERGPNWNYEKYVSKSVRDYEFGTVFNIYKLAFSLSLFLHT